MTLPLNFYIDTGSSQTEKLQSRFLSESSPQGPHHGHACYGNALFHVFLICFLGRRCSMVKSSGEIKVFKKLGNVFFFFFFFTEKLLRPFICYALWISKKVMWFRKTLIWLCNFYYWLHLCSLEECKSHGIRIKIFI